MRLVDNIGGALQLRWTWLPYWLAVNPALKSEIDVELRDVALLNAVTLADIDPLESWTISRIQRRFVDFVGLGEYLRGIHRISQR